MVMRRLFVLFNCFQFDSFADPEVADLVADGVMSEGLTATRLGLSGIPPVAEVIMIERDLRLVELTGGRYHVSRVTTKAELRLSEKLKSQAYL